MRPQNYTENHRWPSKAGHGRDSRLHLIIHEFVVQCQKFSPANIHTRNIWTEQITFRNIYAHANTYVYMRGMAINVKKAP